MDLRIKLLLLCVLLFVSTSSTALEIDATVSSQTEFTSNARLRESDTHSDTLQRFVLDTGIIERRKSFQADANFTIEKDTYLQDSYEDETSFVTGLGLFNFDLVDSFLNWHSSYQRSQVIVDSSLSDTPDNRDVRMVFNTGPAINYSINNASRISLSANYINVENSNPDVSDSERYTTSASYLYRVNSITQVSVSALRGDTIDPDESEEYVNKTYSVGLQRQFSHGEMQFAYGRTFYLPVVSNDVEGNFFQFSFTREKVFFHDVNIAYQQDVSDSSIGTIMVNVPEDGGPVELVNVSITDVVKTKQFDVALNRVLGNLSYNLTALWENVDYSINQNEEYHYRYGAELTHNVSPVLNVTYSYGFDIDQYPDRPEIGKNRTSTYGVDANYSVSEQLRFSGGAEFEIRKNKGVLSEEYEDIGLNFTVSWDIN